MNSPLYPYSTEELINLLDNVEEPSYLEAIGKGLSLPQFLTLIVYFAKSPDLQFKLPSLLVGLSPPLFFQALEDLSPEHLNVLKQSSMTEPLQHQLTLFIHDCERKLQETETFLLDMDQRIQQLQPAHFPLVELEEIEKQMEELQKQHTQYLERINQALALLWNANRIDLIDKLSRLKEHFLHHLHNRIGQSGLQSESATGLYRALDDRLALAFMSSNSIETLEDEDDALEGLTKFSMWYLKDYWELGLLPSIKEVHQLDSEAHQHLLNKVRDNLHRLGLGKVKDLKKARIFSKQLLEKYIGENKALIGSGQ